MFEMGTFVDFHVQKLLFADLNACDSFTFVAAMMTLMAEDPEDTMELMLKLNSGALPPHVADFGECDVLFALTNLTFSLTDMRSLLRKDERVEGPQLPPKTRKRCSGEKEDEEMLEARWRENTFSHTSRLPPMREINCNVEPVFWVRSGFSCPLTLCSTLLAIARWSR